MKDWPPLAAILGLLFSFSLLARPEYAAREKLNCIQCHVNPWGAGPRRIMGKIYGARDLKAGLHNETDLYYADFRALFLKDTKRPNHLTTNGLGLMTATVSANIPIVEKDDGFSTSVLLSYDFGTFAPGTREIYLLWQNNDDVFWQPSSIVFGNFYAPFGLLTDEHRTYTRFQTATTLREREMGGVFSFDPLASLHLDLALTNGLGFKNGGGNLTINDQTFGVISNMRFNHHQWPLLLGTSYSYHQTKEVAAPNPYAYSFYGILTFDQLFKTKWKAHIASELVYARFYNDIHNPRYIGNFIPNTTAGLAYKQAIKDKTSRGLLVNFKWEITPTWIAMVKYDHLLLDNNFKSDSYIRYGLGLRHQINANTLLLLRYEESNIQVPRIEGSHIKSDQKDVFAVLRFWL